jgi:hypothetical protein
MYLLWYNPEIDFFSLVQVEDKDVPPHAILSHTWGADDEELNFQDVSKAGGIYFRDHNSNDNKVHTLLHSPSPAAKQAIAFAKAKAAYNKVQFCGSQAAQDAFGYFWIDSCCIDRSSSAELSEALNSMFRWYRQAANCYVYLADFSTGLQQLENVPPNEWNSNLRSAFQSSRWFTRGWVRS